MKKHELLKYAYDNYPKGCVARFTSMKSADHTSDGVFQILDLNHDGNIGVYSGSGLNCFFISKDEDGNRVDSWATIIKDEPLKVEKIAVKVNNEREFQLLMKHYAEFGWLNCEGEIDDVKFFRENKVLEVTFHNKYSYLCEGSVYPSHTDLGYTVIDFEFWAAQNNVDVPKPIIVSEDGVELFEGDICHHVFNGKNSWNYAGSFNIKHAPINGKTFSTKEAALSWIEKANKPKEIVLDYDTLKVVVTKMGFSAEATDSRRFVFSREDLENIYAAHKSLR